MDCDFFLVLEKGDEDKIGGSVGLEVDADEDDGDDFVSLGCFWLDRVMIFSGRDGGVGILFKLDGFVGVCGEMLLDDGDVNDDGNDDDVFDSSFVCLVSIVGGPSSLLAFVSKGPFSVLSTPVRPFSFNSSARARKLSRSSWRTFASPW